MVESILAATPPLPPAVRIEAFRTLENLSPDTSGPPVLAANTAHHINLVPTLSTAGRLTHSFPDLPAPPHDAQNANELQRWAQLCLERLGSPTGWRLSPAELSAQYPEVSRNHYRSTVRALAHLRRRTCVFEEVLAQERCLAVRKTRLISAIPSSVSPATAHFVSYFSSLLALHPWHQSDEEILDPLAHLLLECALEDPSCDLETIARVHCSPRIVSLLSPAATRHLVAEYSSHLQWLALRLKKLWQTQWGDANFHVPSGANTTAWNHTVYAWEKLRIPYNALAHNSQPLGAIPTLNSYETPPQLLMITETVSKSATPLDNVSAQI